MADIGTVLIVAAAAVCLIVVGTIGYYAADGTPDIIDMTETQKNSIIREQQNICKKETRELNNQIKDLQDSRDKAFDIVQDNFNYYEEFIRKLEKININPDLNFTIQVYDKNTLDYNSFDINISC